MNHPRCPTERSPVPGQVAAIFRIIITGRSAHAGRNPQEGRNAVLAAADLALRLKALTR